MTTAIRTFLGFALGTAALAFSAAPLFPQNSQPEIHYDLTPNRLTAGATANLTVTVDCPAASPDQNLHVAPPFGFTVSPNDVRVCANAATNTQTFTVQAPHGYVPRATNWSLPLTISDKIGQVSSARCPFTFVAGLGLGAYFFLGVIGIGLGYIARMVVDSLNALPKPVIAPIVKAAVAGAPADAAGGGGAPDLGWFSGFIRNHYYLMDFSVTLLLGFGALAALIKDNQTPDTALYWYSALGVGFGIGLLTNSDLITRLRTK